MSHVPRRELEQKYQESSEVKTSTITLECGVIDLHNDTVLSSNGSALEAACGPPGMGANI